MKTKYFIVLFCIFNLFFGQYAKAQNWEWAKSASGSNNNGGNAIAADAAGNLYVAGTFTSPAITFGSTTLSNDSSGTADIFLVKYNAAGVVQWAKRAGGKQNESVKSIATDLAGNVIIAGTYDDSIITFGTTTLDERSRLCVFTNGMYLVKYDTLGNILWANGVDSVQTDHCFSIVSFEDLGVTTDIHNNIYLSISYDAEFFFGSHYYYSGGGGCASGCSGGAILKYNSFGDTLLTINITGYFASIFIHSVAVDSQSNIFFTSKAGDDGSFNIQSSTRSLLGYFSTSYFANFLIVKLDSIGRGKWCNTLVVNDGSPWIFTLIPSITVTSTNQIYVAGVFNNSYVVIGNYDTASSYFSAITDTLRNIDSGTYDFFIAKYDSSGNFIWAKRAGGIGDEKVNGISKDVLGNVYVTGSFTSPSIDFDSGIVLTNSGGTNLFIIKYTADGNVVWAKNVTGTGGNWANGITTDNSNAIYVTGAFTGDSLSCDTNLLINYSTSSQDMFVAKLQQPPASIQQLSVGAKNLLVYPNPTNGQIRVAFANWGYEQITLFDALGREVYHTALTGFEKQVELNISFLKAGLYYLRATNKTSTDNFQIVVN